MAGLNSKISDSEEKFRYIIEHANDFVAIINKRFKFEYINEIPHYKGVGYLKDEMIGKSALDFLHPDDHDKAVDLMKIGFKTGESNGEVRFKHKDGHCVWLEVKGRTFLTKNNEIKGILISRDITERKSAEKEHLVSDIKLHKLNKELKRLVSVSSIELIKSEEKYHNLFENSPFSIALVDNNGVIVECNQAMENLLGFKKDELIGKSFTTFSITLQKNLPVLFQRLRDGIGGEVIPLLDVQLTKKDGSLIWTNLQTSFAKINDETLIEIIGYNVSEKKLAENLIKEEVLKLKELEQIRKDLISSISHELKTPLMSIKGAAELILGAFKDDVGADILDLMDIIERGSTRLGDLVERVLDLSRLDFDKFDLEHQECNLGRVIEDCSNEMKYLLKRREIILSLELSDNLMIHIDKIRVEQIILNLLSNAIKNSPPKSKIFIILHKIEEWAEIKVVDNGVGLTKDEMRDLFQRFNKIKRKDSGIEYVDIRGSGLGLFISKKIVELHDGEIEVNSLGRHKGCTFTVRLPIK